MDANELRIIKIECVTKLQNINLRVIAEITDMGTDYQKAAKKLGITEEIPYYIVNNQKIFYFFDPPHLIKAARNNLLNNVIKSGDKIMSWQYIEKLFEIDKENINRLVPKLAQDTHIYPNNFQRMKVKYAAQVLSFSVASAINTMTALGHLPASAKDTSEYIEKLDAAFDIFSSSSVKGKKSSRNAFVASEKQVKY
ncbi:thap domain-containing [Lasius niger]|uniref:Thap domain-containing n=1 Tax=Lasius niger TaxID=67767 RepID=A0A0J7N4J9_LASNI|nr:thap domain-containing [Lasius niger]